MAACAAAVTALVLTACLPGGGGSEGRSGSSSSASSSESSVPSTPAGEGEGDEVEESFTAPDQREITAAEATKALPTRADMPDQTYQQDISEQTPSTRTYDPTTCAAVEFASESARSFRDKHRTTDEYARFQQPRADGGRFVGVWISSHDLPYPLAYFDEAGAALAECGEYTSTSESGTDFSHETELIPAPTVGERAFAVRIAGDRVNTDRFYVRSGHNLITVMQQTPKDAPFDERLLAKHAQDVLDDLSHS